MPAMTISKGKPFTHEGKTRSPVTVNFGNPLGGVVRAYTGDEAAPQECALQIVQMVRSSTKETVPDSGLFDLVITVASMEWPATLTIDPPLPMGKALTWDFFHDRPIASTPT